MGTPTTKRRYDRTFKERAVKLSYERNHIEELAQKLGFYDTLREITLELRQTTDKALLIGGGVQPF